MMDETIRKRLGYEAIEQYDPERLAKLQEHYTAILELLGEDPKREGLQKTPSKCLILNSGNWRLREGK